MVRLAVDLKYFCVYTKQREYEIPCTKLRKT